MKPSIYVIGCGKQFQNYHLPKLSDLCHYIDGSITIFDTDNLQYNRISSDNFDIIKCHSDEMFWTSLHQQKNSCKLILVCTPPQYHFQLAKRALELKSHVYIEKPMTLNFEDSQNLLTMAKHENRHVVIGVQRRFESIYRKCVQAIKSAGKIRRIFIQNNGNFKDVDPFSIENNILPVGLGYHVCDTLVWFLQEVYNQFSFNFIHSIVQPWEENPESIRAFDALISLGTNDSIIPVHISASLFSLKETVDELLIITGEHKEIQMRRWRIPRDSEPPELFEIRYNQIKNTTEVITLKTENDRPDRSAPLQQFIVNLFNDNHTLMPSSGENILKTDELINLILKGKNYGNKIA